MKLLYYILYFSLLWFTSCNQLHEVSRNRKLSDSLFANPILAESFEHGDKYHPESDWFQTATGKSNTGRWELFEENEDHSIGQVSDRGTGYQFNLFINRKILLKDLAISVDFKCLTGKQDQGGGLVWRFQDSLNYYISRANPLENNFRLYKVVGGIRKQLESYSLPVITGEWHNVTITQKDSLIHCFYDGQLFLNVTDSEIIKPGLIGFWTKADARTLFDNLKISVLN